MSTEYESAILALEKFTGWRREVYIHNVSASVMYQLVRNELITPIEFEGWADYQYQNGRESVDMPY